MTKDKNQILIDSFVFNGTKFEYHINPMEFFIQGFINRSDFQYWSPEALKEYYYGYIDFFIDFATGIDDIKGKDKSKWTRTINRINNIKTFEVDGVKQILTQMYKLILSANKLGIIIF